MGQPATGEVLRKMYTTFLASTSIRSKKKLHLACRTMPTLLEDMGYVLVYHAGQLRVAYICK